ncbi:MAG: hypothetical protein HY865_02730 [Chloroflexi bacterium]|nr:hypothetical protein [Chloroflexota bacterium]
MEKLLILQQRLGVFRWLVFFLILAFPVWFLQYTSWGKVFSDIYIRILMWSLLVFLLAMFLAKDDSMPGWGEFIVAILLTSSAFTLAASFKEVTNYPFSLGWSEGNRMWDYSVLFGRQLYDYPADREIFVFLETNRQFIGALPFLIPGLTIGMERFWIALITIVPYLLLGFAVFRFDRSNLKIWLLGSLWVFIFLKQGPIHTPLILCAMVVALLWKRPLWLALPLIAVTGYVAHESRFTWLFAPGIWLGMLELAGASLQNNRLDTNVWVRAVLLGLVGMAGGQYGSAIVSLFVGGPQVDSGISVVSAISRVSAPTQPLLWYRLLPNETYGPGIIVGLAIATLPLMAFLTYLLLTRKWTPNIWQKLAMIVPLLAFLVVGLVVSTKIGGGGDLHNTDMFLIGLVFTAIIAWQNGGGEWLMNNRVHLYPLWVKLALVLLFAIPGLQPLGQMQSYHFGENASWLKTLSGAKSGSEIQVLPAQDEVDSALRLIQGAVDKAKTQGEVLFMDQRQLLTFGYIKDVPLVPDYEKKLLMDRAMSEDAAYFDGFYADLAAHRFSLIISQPMARSKKDISVFEFGEENNAWVKWVTRPVMCYYTPLETMKNVNVQLLVPREDTVDCSSVLP